MANNKLDLRKLVWMHSLKQLAERIKLLYYNKVETDEILENYIKDIRLNGAILEKQNQEVSINIESGIQSNLYWETF